MSSLDHHTLLNLSRLCRIDCSDAELNDLLPDIKNFVEYFKQLDEVDTTGVKACDHVLEEHVSEVGMPLREDEVEDVLSREAFLDNSPQHIGGMVRVPSVM